MPATPRELLAAMRYVPRMAGEPASMWLSGAVGALGHSGGIVVTDLSVFSEAAWFSACGLPLERSDVTDARAYLDALGVHPSVRIEAVASWEHAERVLRNPRWDPSWWQREDSERRRLASGLKPQAGTSGVSALLGIGVGPGHEIILGAAMAAAARAGVHDAALIRVAAGAAGMAAHDLLLARSSELGGGQVFMRKYEVFAGGRWPLGLLGSVFQLF